MVCLVSAISSGENNSAVFVLQSTDQKNNVQLEFVQPAEIVGLVEIPSHIRFFPHFF
jgi:hypothetical protein